MHTAFVLTSPRSTPGLGCQGAAVFCFTLGLFGTAKSVTSVARARPAVDAVAPQPTLLSAVLDNTDFRFYGGGDGALEKHDRDVFSSEADRVTTGPPVRERPAVEKSRSDIVWPTYSCEAAMARLCAR